jgi:CRP-like cAMP-binding protein
VNPARPVATQRNRLLASLPQSDRALLDPHLKETTFAARTVLHDAQDDIQQVLFPHSGMISILAVTDDGEAIETAVIGSEGALGALAGLGVRSALGRAVVQIPAVCGALHSVEARLARWLLQAHDRTGDSAIELIQEFLAQVLGVRRTTVNLAVRTLQEAGLIQYRRGKVEIRDRSGLLNQSCACYRIVRRQLERVMQNDKP